MMRRYTYNNIVKAARLLSLVVLMAFGAGLKGWGQTTIISNYPSQYGQSVETLYVKKNEPKTVRFQEDASESIDGYISWYIKKANGDISITEISNGNDNNKETGLTNVANRKYWIRYKNEAPTLKVSSIKLNVKDFPGIPDTLILEASTFNEFSKSGNNWTSPLITIQKKYVIKNASYRSTDLTDRRTLLNGDEGYSGWYSDNETFLKLKNDADKGKYFLDVYEIHTPLKSLSGVYGTNYRLSEKLSNYYVGDNTLEASQVRWTVYDVNGNLKQSYYTTSNIWDHTFGQSDGVDIDDNKTQIVYVVAEVAYGSSVWYPVSFLTIYLEPNSEVITEDNFNDDAYKHRTTEYLEKNGYLKISEVSFDDGLIPFSDLNASNNFLNSPISNANSVYAYAYPRDFMERKGNRLSAGRNEYGLYRSLHYYEGSNKNVSHGYVSINNDKGLYNDWFSGQGRDNYQEQVYNKYILDRTYYKTNKTQLGHFLYLDASDDPGVITKINLNEKLCPSTSLVFTAWICDMAHQTTATHADIGFTLKGVKGNSETILTKFYSGKINNSPENIDINTINQGEEYGLANWQQVYFSFSFDSPEEAEYDSYILEVSNNCPNSNGADYAIDDIQVWRSTPNIEVIRLDACEADSLTVSSDYETLLRNMGWTEGEPVVTKGHIYNGAVLDENLIKYRLGLNGADPGNPTTATENSYVGNTYFSFVEGFQDDNSMTLEDVTGDPSKEPDPIILPDDKNGVDNYRWVRINKSLPIPSHAATYAFRAIVTTQSPNSTPNYTYPQSREEALKYERVFNLRAVKDFNYLLKNWDAVYGNIPKPDWLSTADVQSITVSDELQKSRYYTITNIAGISDLPNMLPNEVEAYDKAITELYTHLLIPRIRVPWYVDGTMYLYTVDVRNTDLKHNGESVLNADGTTSTATGKYHVVLQGANAVESWDPETAATATFNLLDPCLLISPFTLYGSIQITVVAETVLSARACAGTQRKISAQLLSKDDGEPLTGVYYSFDWFLGGGYKEYWKISVDGYDLKSMLAVVRADKSFPGEITYANVNSWNPADGAKQAIRKKLLELLNPEDAKLVTDKKDFSWLLSADSLVAMPFITEGAANTSYCTEITAAPVPLYSTDVPELHPGFTLNNGIAYPFEGEVSLRLGRVNMGVDLKLAIPMQAGFENSMAERASSLGLSNTLGVPIMLNNIEAQYPEIGLATDMSIMRGAADGTVTIQLNEKAKRYLQEGQRYELLIPFVQYDRFGQRLASECDGLISLPVKIVPEYLTWKGESADNWYDESKWNQSTKEELYFNGWDGADSDTDANGSDDVAKAFSPLYFTKITIPEETELALKSLNVSQITVGSKTYDVLNDWAADDSSDSIRYEMAVANADGEIVPYYINKVEQIYFKPKALLKNQQYLNYKKAWVEFEMKKGEKYWLSSPLKDVFAGDMYAPTGTGRQTTPAFTDIKYIHGDQYNRWNPAFYQKAWDKGVTYYTQSESGGFIQNTVSAVKSNWSIEYNDVNVPYSLGKGFYASVEGEFTNDHDNKALVRLPKADDAYSYYTKAATISSIKDRTYAGKLAGKEDVVITLIDKDDADSWYDETEEKMNFADGDGKHFLLGNPYMYPLNMEAFFNGNRNNNIDLFERKYWVLNNGMQDAVVVGTLDVGFGENTGAIDNLGQIPPMTAFFVELKDSLEADVSLKVTFTTDMMADNTATTRSVETKSLTASNPILTLTAERGETRSVARLLTSDKGHDEYEASEDAVILLDSELDAPMVYTVAGDVAAQFNTMQSIKNVPLGVYADKGEEVELTIRGISQFAEKLYLYDAVTKQSTPLDDDSYTFRVTGPSHGRFTLTSQNRISAESDICVYSPTPGQLLVMSAPEEPLQRVQVYDMSGRMVTSRDNIGNTTSQLTVPSGIYVVYAENETGNVRVKVRVR